MVLFIGIDVLAVFVVTGLVITGFSAGRTVRNFGIKNQQINGLNIRITIMHPIELIDHTVADRFCPESRYYASPGATFWCAGVV